MAVACIVPCCTDTELFACFMLSCVSCFGSSDMASLWLRTALWFGHCENLTTRHYKYLHKVRSALLASASNKNQKHKETSTNVTATLFTTNTEDMYADVTYCYSGSSAQLLVFLRDESCKTCISNSSHQLQSSKIIMETSRENPTSKTLTVFTKYVQIFQSCKVQRKSITKLQIQ